MHPTQIQNWKSSLISGSEVVFSKGSLSDDDDNEKRFAELERKIGQLTIENDYLKKNWVRYNKKND